MLIFHIIDHRLIDHHLPTNFQCLPSKLLKRKINSHPAITPKSFDINLCLVENFHALRRKLTKKLISHRRAVQRPCLMSKFSRIFWENKNLTQHAQEVEKLVAKKLVEEKEENSINRKPSEISSLIKLQKAACSLTVKNSISFISSSCYVTLYVLL